jgi:predicted nucleotidyltransferase
LPGTTSIDFRAQIQEIVRRVVNCAGPERIILFGSHARGNPGPDSDVDLLVVMPLRGSRRRQATAIERALVGVDLPVDLIVVTPEELEHSRSQPGTVIRAAAEEGEVLYERGF